MNPRIHAMTVIPMEWTNEEKNEHKYSGIGKGNKIKYKKEQNTK